MCDPRNAYSSSNRQKDLTSTLMALGRLSPRGRARAQGTHSSARAPGSGREVLLRPFLPVPPAVQGSRLSQDRTANNLRRDTEVTGRGQGDSWHAGGNTRCQSNSDHKSRETLRPVHYVKCQVRNKSEALHRGAREGEGRSSQPRPAEAAEEEPSAGSLTVNPGGGSRFTSW